jgi:hypothetical protein
MHRPGPKPESAFIIVPGRAGVNRWLTRSPPFCDTAVGTEGDS